jgi:hypothetical protein
MENMILRKLIIEFLEVSSSTCNIDKQKVLQNKIKIKIIVLTNYNVFGKNKTMLPNPSTTIIRKDIDIVITT